MFPPFLCHLPFRLSASLYIFFGKAKSTNYFTDSLILNNPFHIVTILQKTQLKFINWTINGDVDRFYETMRWKNWQDELKNINGFQGLLIYPFLWAEGPAFEERMRKVVPIDELWALTMDNFNRLSQ